MDDNRLRWNWIALTSLLHVTCTRYTVSGQRDNSTLDESVNKWPIRPPPETSHVTIQLLCKLCGSHAKYVDTRNSCSTIDAIRTGQECSDDAWRDMDVHVSQHYLWKWKLKKERERCLFVISILKFTYYYYTFQDWWWCVKWIYFSYRENLL